MKNRMKRMLFCLVLAFVLSACSAGNGAESTPGEKVFSLYVLNHDKTAVVPEDYEMKNGGRETAAAVEEVLGALQAAPGNLDHIAPISDNAVLREYRLEGNLLTLDFDVRYLDMDPATEALTRAAIVLSVTGIDGVEGVLFLVSGTALMKNETEPVGVMHADSFVLSGTLSNE